MNPPELREDLRIGKLCAAVINSQGGWEGGKKAGPADFFPYLAKAMKGAAISTRGPENWQLWKAFLVDKTLASGGHVDQAVLDEMREPGGP